MGGVEQLEKYAGCIKCTAKILSDQDDPDVGECVKCGILQCLDAAKVGIVAHLVVKTESATASTKHQYLALRAFGATLADISQTNDVEKITKMSLLKAKPFTMFYRDGIIQSINRTLQTQ